MAWHPLRFVRRLLAEELARGASVNLAFTVLNGVLGILAAVLAARALGPRGLGIVSIGFLLVEFASILDNFPTVGFMRRYSHRPEARDVATVLGTKGALGLATTALILALSPLVARVFDVPLSVPIVFAFIPTASIVSSVAIMAHEARRDMARRNGPTTVEAVTRVLLYGVVAVAPFVPAEFMVEAVSLATLAASFAGTAAGLYWIPRLTLRGFDRVLAREYLSFGARTQASGVLNKIIFWFDIVVIDLVLGHATQGLYRTAYTLMAYLTLAAGTVSIMLFPSIANAHAEGRVEDVRRTLSLGFFYSVGLVLPLAAALVAFPRFLIVTAFGPEFEGAAWMLQALAGVGVIAVAVLPFQALLPAVNRPDLSLRLTLGMVLVNSVLNVVLIPRIGVPGAIAATVATFVTGVALGAYYTRKLGIELPRLRDLTDVLAGRTEAVPPP